MASTDMMFSSMCHTPDLTSGASNISPTMTSLFERLLRAVKCSCYDKRRIALVLLTALCTYMLLVARYGHPDARQGSPPLTAQLQQGAPLSVRRFRGGKQDFQLGTDQQGFVLPLAYTGQLVAGLRAVISVQCWLSSFRLPMVMVEPYVNESMLRQGSDFWKQMDTVKGEVQAVPTSDKQQHSPMSVSDLFNLRLFNEMSKKQGRPQLATMETFWERAPRRLIVVALGGYLKKDCLRYSNKAQCQLKERKVDDRERSLSGCPQYEHVENTVTYLVSRGFEIVRTVCLNCTVMDLTPTEVTDHIFGEFSPANVTLVVSHWKYSFEITQSCVPCTLQTTNEQSVLAQFSPSQQLVREANAYLQPLREKALTKVIAIMIRIEWFLIMHKGSSLDHVKTCLSQILNEYDHLSNMYPDTKTVLALDIGKYGSSTFDGTLRRNNISNELFSKVVEEIQQFVKKVNLNYGEWEESFDHFVSNITGNNQRSQVAMLQSVTVSQADYIIRMGGGHYQHLALQLFMDNHQQPLNYIKEVCMTKNFVVKRRV